MGAFKVGAVSTEKSQSSSAGLLSRQENKKSGSPLTTANDKLKKTNVFDPNVANLAYTSSPFTNIFGSQQSSASAVRGYSQNVDV